MSKVNDKAIMFTEDTNVIVIAILFLQVKFKWTLDWIWKKVQIKDTYQYMKILSHWITKNVLFYFVL